MAPVRRKVVLVGYGACGIPLRWIRELCFNADLNFPGKTCLISAFVKGKFPEMYVPTVFEEFIGDVGLDGRLVELSIWDLNGLSEYEGLRSLFYPGSHVILVCYSIDIPGSLDDVVKTV